MTREQALKIIDQALAQLKLTRQEHATLIEAINVLSREESK